MPDVWDLTKEGQGDHVLIALTLDECSALLDENDVRYSANPHTIRAREEIARTVRDQKDVEL